MARAPASEQPFARYGGQAVLEGVMIRGPHAMAVAVRDPHGKIVLHQELLQGRITTSRWAKLPLVRGMVALWDTMALGLRALMGEPAERPEGWGAWLLLLFPLALGIALFIVLPAALAEAMARFLGWPPGARSALEGLLRLGLGISYLGAIGRRPEVRRVFAYHGAEHKVVHALEAGAPLTVAGARPFPTAHPRCGTAFLLTVILIAIVLFAFLPGLPLLARVAVRLALLPALAALAYEFLLFSARFASVRPVAWLSAPNLWLQRLTTREPDEGMLEVALAALEAARALETPQAQG